MVFEIIEGVRKFKTDNKIRLGEEIAAVKISGNPEVTAILQGFQDDIIGISRAGKIEFSDSAEFSFEFVALTNPE